MKSSAAAWMLAGAVLLGQIRFEDAGSKSGLDFRLSNNAAGQFHLVELMPGGIAAFDYNNDGCTDIYFTNGAALPGMEKTGPSFHNRLFRNNCDLTWSDVTAKAGVAGSDYSMAAAAGDYDNDGFVDLFVAGVNRNTLYRNLGDGTFLNATARARLEGIDKKYGKMWSISAGWLDADNDGWLDLFVSNYVGWDPRTERPCGTPQNRSYCHPDIYAGRPHQLFRNNRDGTFTDCSVSSGVADSIGKGMGVAFADFNRDGRTDVFVANDSIRNFLFHNLGGMRFREVGLEAGASLGEHGRPIAGMGVDFRDFDNDGLPDIVVTGMVNDTFLLFRNLGKQLLFEDHTAGAGLVLATRQLTGWGAGMYDFDNDGFKDLFFANSHFPQLGRYLGVPSPLPNSVFRNLGNGRFQDVSKQAGADFQAPGYYRGAAFADFDRDGRVDVVVSAVNGPARLFRNVSPRSAHWIAFHLRGTTSNRDGLGAEVHVTLPDGRILSNHATTSVGYASSSEPVVRFGLGSHTRVPRVEIRWPSGRLQLLKDVIANSIIIKVVEPRGASLLRPIAAR